MFGNGRLSPSTARLSENFHDWVACLLYGVRKFQAKAFLSGTGAGGVGPRLSTCWGPPQNVCIGEEFSS